MKMKQEYTMSKTLKEQHNIGNDKVKDDITRMLKMLKQSQFSTTKTPIEQEDTTNDSNNGV